jgi:HSP20 family protein
MSGRGKKGKSLEAKKKQSVDPISGFRSEMERLFDSYFGRGWMDAFPRMDFGFAGAGVVPQVDMVDDKKAITISAELPGLEEKDVELTLHDGILTLKGEKRLEKKEEKDTQLILERRYGGFQRSFRLPDEVDEGQIRAHFDKGVLKVEIPKRPEAVRKAKRIEITRS